MRRIADGGRYAVRGISVRASACVSSALVSRGGSMAMGAEVLVAGGGPAGLLTALQLKRLGHDVLVMERRLGEFVRQNVVTINTPAFMELERMGIGQVLEAGASKVQNRYGGLHFPIRAVERAVRDAAQEAGVRFVDDVRVDTVRDGASSITARAGSDEFEGAYLLNATGSRIGVEQSRGMTKFAYAPPTTSPMRTYDLEHPHEVGVAAEQLGVFRPSTERFDFPRYTAAVGPEMEGQVAPIVPALYRGDRDAAGMTLYVGTMGRVSSEQGADLIRQIEDRVPQLRWNPRTDISFPDIQPSIAPKMVDGRFIAVGDSVSSPDPRMASGVTQAINDSVAAASAIDEALRNPANAATALGAMESKRMPEHAIRGASRIAMNPFDRTFVGPDHLEGVRILQRWDDTDRLAKYVERLEQGKSLKL